MLKRIGLTLMLLCSSAFAEEPPKNFFYHKDTLISALQSTWSDIGIPSVIPGLIEQETCITLQHSKCWSRKAHLKTKHEEGIGLGQFTITSRFNAFEEIKLLDSRLKDWRPEDYWNAEKQMIALVVKMKYNHKVFKTVSVQEDRFAFALAAYNGGVGGILKDQRICRNTPNCNSNLWFGNTEHTSLKTKKPFNGFRKSAFQINREYPYNILKVRRFKYKPHIDSHFKLENPES